MCLESLKKKKNIHQRTTQDKWSIKPASPFLYQAPAVLPSCATHPEMAPSPINHPFLPVILRTTKMPFPTSERQPFPLTPFWDRCLQRGLKQSSQLQPTTFSRLPSFDLLPSQTKAGDERSDSAKSFFFFQVILNMGHNPELWAHRAQSWRVFKAQDIRSNSLIWQMWNLCAREWKCLSQKKNPKFPKDQKQQHGSNYILRKGPGLPTLSIISEMIPCVSELRFFLIPFQANVFSPLLNILHLSIW